MGIYTFVLIKNKENREIYHPIMVEYDSCNKDAYLLKESILAVYKKEKSYINIDDAILDPTEKYLIQMKDTGDFAYYSVGNPLHIFENQQEIEQDIYHYYYAFF